MLESSFNRLSQSNREKLRLQYPPCFQCDRYRCSSVIEQVQLQVSEASDRMGWNQRGLWELGADGRLGALMKQIRCPSVALQACRGQAEASPSTLWTTTLLTENRLRVLHRKLLLQFSVRCLFHFLHVSKKTPQSGEWRNTRRKIYLKFLKLDQTCYIASLCKVGWRKEPAWSLSYVYDNMVIIRWFVMIWVFLNY